MLLRNQRDGRGLWWTHDDNREVGTTRIYPREVFETYEAGFALGLACPGVMYGRRRRDDGRFIMLSHAESGSWASFAVDDKDGDEGHEVLQCGPRRLWDELEAAYLWWVDAGRPDHTRFGVTVDPTGQVFWLDSPGGARIGGRPAGEVRRAGR
jgi:hypothetical protein